MDSKNINIKIFSIIFLAKYNNIGGINVNDKKKIEAVLPANSLKSENIHKNINPNISIDKKTLTYGFFFCFSKKYEKKLTLINLKIKLEISKLLIYVVPT